MVFTQVCRSWAICKKDIKIYYLKGPVLLFGVLFPLFLFLAFYIGRDLPASFLIPGLIGMTLFFTATSVGPVIAPWETRMRVLERLVSAPVSLSAILLGDVLASLIFGLLIALVPLLIGLLIGVGLFHSFIFTVGLILAAFCFSWIGMLFSAPPADVPANVMMLSALVKFPLIFISGIFVPLERMPSWGRALSSISPLTYFTDLMRYSVQNTHYFPIALDLVVLAGFAVLAAIAALWFHHRSLPKRF